MRYPLLFVAFVLCMISFFLIFPSRLHYACGCVGLIGGGTIRGLSLLSGISITIADNATHSSQRPVSGSQLVTFGGPGTVMACLRLPRVHNGRTLTLPPWPFYTARCTRLLSLNSPSSFYSHFLFHSCEQSSAAPWSFYYTLIIYLLSFSLLESFSSRHYASSLSRHHPPRSRGCKYPRRSRRRDAGSRGEAPSQACHRRFPQHRTPPQRRSRTGPAHSVQRSRHRQCFTRGCIELNWGRPRILRARPGWH